jgi:HEAT repeat protein
LFPQLVAFVSADDSTTSANAASALGWFGDARAVVPLMNAVRSEQLGLRTDAATALGRLKDRRAVDPLLHLLRISRCREDALAAIAALGRIGDKRAIDPLIDEIERVFDNERGYRAAKALAWIGVDAGLPLAKRMLRMDAEAAEHARRALDWIRQESPAPDPLADDLFPTRRSRSSFLDRIRTKRAGHKRPPPG